MPTSKKRFLALLPIVLKQQYLGFSRRFARMPRFGTLAVARMPSSPVGTLAGSPNTGPRRRNGARVQGCQVPCPGPARRATPPMAYLEPTGRANFFPTRQTVTTDDT